MEHTAGRNHLAIEERGRSKRSNFMRQSGRTAFLFNITSSSCHCSLTTPTTTSLLIIALLIRLFQAPFVPLRSSSSFKPVYQQVSAHNEYAASSKYLDWISWVGVEFERKLEEQHNESLLTELAIIHDKDSRNVVNKAINYAAKNNIYNRPYAIVRPLLTSVQPSTNVWSTITSSDETPLQDDVNFYGMMWWGEMRRKKSADMAGCSRDEQFEEELHSKLFGERMDEHKFLSTDTQQIFDRWHDSSKSVWLQENDDHNALHPSNCADQQCSFTELFDKCDSYGIEQQQSNNNNFLLNSTLECPILHNNVSLADAAICDRMNGSDLVRSSELDGSASPEWCLDDRSTNCASNDLLEDENSSDEWKGNNVGDDEKSDEVANDHHRSNEVQYTSTSVVELLDDDESNESFCCDTHNDSVLTTTDTLNDTNDVDNSRFADDEMHHRRIGTFSSLLNAGIERRLICTSPQFRLPYESDTDSAKSCSSNSSISQPYSESFKSSREEEYNQQYEESISRETASGQTTSSASADFVCDHFKLHASERRGRGRRSRDEELAHAYLLPLSAMQISSMPLTELNRIVHSLQLTSQQQNMIRKIRRRGKNKLAARVCRKRKNDRVKV